MRRIIAGTDTGMDDSLAILYALRSPNFYVEGVITCFGSNSAEQSADNCLRPTRFLGCGYGVPVAMGSNEPLDGVFDLAPAHIHGDSGIGNAELPEGSREPMGEIAWNFIIRKAGELKDEPTVITTRRMTNLACVLEKDPELPSKVKKVVTMGGTLKKPGSVNPYAEVSIYGDVKAADRVLRAGFNLALVGLSATMKTFITDRNVRNLRTYCQEECRAIADYIRDVLRFYFELHWVFMGMAEACMIHNPLAALIIEDPSLEAFRMVRAGVEYEHEPFQDMIKTDTGFVPVLDREEIAVCMEVDSEKAVRRLFSLFQDTTPGRYNRE